MLVTRGLGRRGSSKGAFVNFGFGISPSGILLEVPASAFLLSWPQTSALATDHYFAKSGTIPLTETVNAPDIGITQNYFAKSNLLELNASLQNPNSIASTNYWAKPSILELVENLYSPNIGITNGYWARSDTIALNALLQDPSLQYTSHYYSKPNVLNLSLAGNISGRFTDNQWFKPDLLNLNVIGSITAKASDNKWAKVGLTQLHLTSFPPTVPLEDGFYVAQVPVAGETITMLVPIGAVSNHYYAKVNKLSLAEDIKVPGIVVTSNYWANVIVGNLDFNSSVDVRVSDHKKIEVPNGGLHFTDPGILAKVSDHIRLLASTGQLVLNEISPNIILSDNKLLVPDSIGLNLGSGIQWSLSDNALLKLDPLTLELLAKDPTLGWAYSALVNVGNLDLSTLTPALAVIYKDGRKQVYFDTGIQSDTSLVGEVGTVYTSEGISKNVAIEVPVVSVSQAEPVRIDISSSGGKINVTDAAGKVFTFTKKGGRTNVY